MTPSGQKSKAVALALWANAALLTAILLVLVNRSGTPGLLPAAFAQNQQPPIAGGAGLFVMPAQMKSNVWGCYLLDVDNQTLCAYEYWGGDHLLRLAASRDIRYDRKLKRFNTESPTPNEVKAMIEREAANPNAAAPAKNDN
jgi:hypothetical protein